MQTGPFSGLATRALIMESQTINPLFARKQPHPVFPGPGISGRERVPSLGPRPSSNRGGGAPVGVPHQALQVVEVHEAELAHWGLQVQVDHMLPADSLQVLAVGHPAEVVDDLLVARDLESVPVRPRFPLSELAISAQSVRMARRPNQ